MNDLIKNIEDGNLVIVPTDTVYGIHADATNTEAIRRVDEAKNSNKPHLILISSIKMLEEYILEIEPLQRKLIDKYWPGPLTILFKKNSKLSDELTKNSEYVAVRMPNDKFLLELIDTFNKPIISTSANISNGDVIKNISLLDSKLKNKVSYIYNIGTIKSVPSTLIKIIDNKIVFLREGSLSEEIKTDFKEYI